jgi:methionyl-tRNA synthetase
MLSKYSGGIVSKEALRALKEDALWEGELRDAILGYRDHFDNMRPSEALKKVWDLVSMLNKRIDTEQPWVLAKSEETKERLELLLASLIKGLTLIGALLYPVMPSAAEEMWRRLKLPPGSHTLDSDALTLALSHGLPIEIGEPFFARAEQKDKPASPKAPAKSPEEPKITGPLEVVSHEDFAKLELKAALIFEAEPLKKSDKLMKLRIRTGENEERTIVAGIAKAFTAEELIGQTVIIVANLSPRKLMGIESRGMVLCAKTGDSLALLVPNRPTPPGSNVS